MIRFILAALVSAHAHGLTLEASKGKTEFLAIGRPSALKINGKGSGPTGTLELRKAGDDLIVSGEAVVDLSSLDTGIGLRDRHMKETYLETGKFKTARLLLKDAKVPRSSLERGGEVKVPALLDLHGQLKPIEIAMTLSKKEDAIVSASKFKIKLSEFAINIPKYAGITVADEVEVRTETEVSGAVLKEGT